MSHLVCSKNILSSYIFFLISIFRNTKKPLRPKLTVKVTSSSGKPIPVLASYLADDSDCTIVIAHGSFLRPVFERVVSRIFPPLCMKVWSLYWMCAKVPSSLFLKANNRMHSRKPPLPFCMHLCTLSMMVKLVKVSSKKNGFFRYVLW